MADGVVVLLQDLPRPRPRPRPRRELFSVARSSLILLRFAASALLLWVVVAARRTAFPGWRLVDHAVVAGLMTQGVQFLGSYWAPAHGVASGLGSSVIALNPVATAGIMAIVLGHRESRRGASAPVLATGAVVLACAPKIVQDHGAGPGAVAVVVVAVVGRSGGVDRGRHCAGMDTWLGAVLGLTASTPLAGAVAAWPLRPPPRSSCSPPWCCPVKSVR